MFYLLKRVVREKLWGMKERCTYTATFWGVVVCGEEERVQMAGLSMEFIKDVLCCEVDWLDQYIQYLMCDILIFNDTLH